MIETDTYGFGSPILKSNMAVDGERDQLMWLRDMLRSLLRRWYLLLVCLAATAAGTYLVYQAVPVSYSAKGSLVLMPPKTSVGPNGNPYLYLGGMNQALDVLSSKLSAEDTMAPILAAHPGISYSAVPDRSSSGSVVLATVRGADRNDVMSGLAAVMDVVPTTLTAMQITQAVPPDSRISLMTLVVDRQTTTDAKTRTMSVLAAGGGGAALGILLVGFIDGRLLARQARLGAKAAPAADAGQPVGRQRKRRRRPAAPVATVAAGAEDTATAGSDEAAHELREPSAAGSKG